MTKKITSQEIPLITWYIREVSGIEIDESKTYLLESRLSPLLERFDFSNYAELARKAHLDSKGEIKKQVIDAISTNETSFFRDIRPFNLLIHKMLPEHFERKGDQASLNIWSAASSTGQEVYSIAMAIKELLNNLFKYSIKILGTDISSAAIQIASMGRYTQLEVSRGLSDVRLKKYFKPNGTHWQISDELRSLAQFKKINLLKPLSTIGSFDIILCRNVAIYFSPLNRKLLFKQLSGKLKLGGVLIIGSTESLVGITDKFTKHEFHGANYYVLKNKGN